MAIALLFLLAHVPFLPPALEDIDSINFAMGVRHFDVALHQPHPPGYPVFIVLAKASTALFRAAGAETPELHGLAAWGPLSGAILLIAAFAFFRALGGDDLAGVMAVALVAASPLFWFTALRPLSDTAGLAAAMAALAATMAAISGPTREWTPARTRLLVVGAIAAGLSAGFRIQMAVLTAPLLAFAVLWPRAAAPRQVRIAAFLAAVCAVALWAVPLLIASGGPAAYFQALRSQAGDDFSGVVMLWTHPGLRVAAVGMLQTFVLPWDSPALGGIVVALASAGGLVLLWRSPRAVLFLALVFAPYTMFHLLFQETLTVRYALPILLPVGYLAAVVFAQARSPAPLIAAAILVAASLAYAAPAAAGFGRVPSPVFALLSDIRLLEERGARPTVAMHRRVLSESRRARQWTGWVPDRLLAAPRDYEWLELTRNWRGGQVGDVWFLADPRRTDLALIDAEHRRTREYRWPFHPAVYVGGTRPNQLDWHVYGEPGWFLEQGWALTPEIAGITERDGWGPHRQPSIGWIRRTAGEVLMMIGGRHLGAAEDPPVRLVASFDDRPVRVLEAGPGFFFEFDMLPAGTLAGEGTFARLTIRAESVGSGDPPAVAVEQFNVQSPDVVQFAFADGWHEPEYNPRTARSWRWMSEAAVLQIHNAGREVALRITGENPRRYFGSGARLRVSAAGRTLAELTPREDFTLEASVAADLLSASNGRVLLESDRAFVPGDRDGSADQRQLAFRIYSVEVR